MRIDLMPVDSLPIARFGTGGDYVRDWPPPQTDKGIYDAAGLFGQIGRIAAVLALAARTAWKALAACKIRRKRTLPTPSTAPVCQIRPDSQVSAVQTCRSVQKWRKTHEPQCQTQRFILLPQPDPHPPAAPNPPLRLRVPQQKWLFPDLAGDGQKPTAKQGYRLRARRSSRTKRIAAQTAQQGTLFDA